MLNALSLNSWLIQVWSETWPEKTPAADLYRINLWKELSKSLPPPQPLEPDFRLYSMLDENYSTMTRYKIDPGYGLPSTPLVEWRRKISKLFKEQLHEDNVFHPSELPLYVEMAIADGIVTCPASISIAGFESPAPIETDLFKLLGSKSNIEYNDISEKKHGRIEAITLPSQEQEVIYLAHRLIEDARVLPLHRIGVVVPNLSSYSNMIERCLKELTGGSPPEGSSWFNITLGTLLSASPLIMAALLPLRFATEGEPRELFLSLILSPYYGCWQKSRHVCSRADIVWREHANESGIDNLLNSLKKNSPDILEKILCEEVKNLLKFFRLNFLERKKAGHWIDEMEGLWSSLGFPVISDEKDTIDSMHLREIIDDMSRRLGNVEMDGHEFLSWVVHVTSGRVTQTGASEDAGIQIMGLIESRGLDFDKLYVLGLDDRSLPQPVRPLPLLDISERNLVPGGTPESQYEFGLRAFSNLISLAPSVTLMRAEQKDSKPLSPSPFWPESESKSCLDIWSDPGPAWVRAHWLRSAYEGFQVAADGGDLKIAGIKKADDSLFDETVIPHRMSVSSIETAIICPFRFFVADILQIKPLEDMKSVVSPVERGTRIHRALAAFTREVRRNDLHLEQDEQKIFKLLSQCVDEALRDVADLPQWTIEQRLLLSEDLPPGILVSWLDAEKKHHQDGWKCIAEEAGFKGLQCKGWSFPLEGRIDRIDHHEKAGLIGWDYKTGNHPKQKDVLERFTAPQLPVYLLALRMGKVPVANKYVNHEEHISAGYVHLKTPAKVKMIQIRGIEGFLDKWIEVIADLEEILQKGNFRSNPYPVSKVEDRESACENCPCLTLCERGIMPAAYLPEQLHQ